MSGHSKWSKIKRKKGALDEKRGQIFTKLSHSITVAAQEGGGDPDMNFSLRLAIDKAKEANMPKDNIEKAIKKGTGELGSEERLENVSYEGYGPGGVALIVDTTTDNRNRTVAEVRHILESHGGSLGADGTVSWQFEERGLITIKSAKLQRSEQFGKPNKEIPNDMEDSMLELFDIGGVEDVYSIDLDNDSKSGLEIHCSKVNLSDVRTAVEDLKFVIISSEIIKIAKSPITVDANLAAKVDNLVEELEDNEDVQSVWTNIKE